MKPVLIIGGSGVFGSHVAEQWALAGGKSILLGGRSQAKASPLIEKLAKLGCEARFVAVDRASVTADALDKLGVSAVVDAAGPFQASTLHLPTVCMAARVAYLDLADGRAFVRDFATLDAQAKQAGVALVTGASSTPALSHAVVDRLSKGWQRIDRILVAISPGNSAPRGRSVIQAILSWVGEPVRVFQNGAWRWRRGWGAAEVITLAGVGQRQVALCETPDLDLLVERYQPLLSAEFKAGLELGVMHQGLRLLSALRAARLLPNLRVFTPALQAVAAALSPLGTDRGGMFVRVEGRNAAGEPAMRAWHLAVGGGQGPAVPSLAAVALLQRLGSLRPGARAAAGEVHYEELLPLLNQLGAQITEVETSYGQKPELFERALGPAWWGLPAITRAIHRATPSLLLTGEAEVAGAESALGRWLAKVFGFPPEGQGQPLQVVIESDGERENWQRIYPQRTMRSVMGWADAATSTVRERFGLFSFELKLEGHAQGIDMLPSGWRMGRLPLPAALAPRIRATERASADGARHLFDVEISLPVVGRLVHYRGWLEPKA